MNKHDEQKYFNSRLAAAKFLASSVSECHTKSQSQTRVKYKTQIQ